MKCAITPQSLTPRLGKGYLLHDSRETIATVSHVDSAPSPNDSSALTGKPPAGQTFGIVSTEMSLPPFILAAPSVRSKETVEMSYGAEIAVRTGIVSVIFAP